MARSEDPITELISSLEVDGKPTLAWVLAWSRGGAEPVQAAWEHSGDVLAMARVLARAGRQSDLELLRKHGILPRTSLRGVLSLAGSFSLVRRFHLLVPRAPTLGELLRDPRGG